MKEIARLFILGGGVLLFIGLVLYVAGDRLKWFGNLPGDLRIERLGVNFYMPITSMLLLSVALSLVIWLIRKLL